MFDYVSLCNIRNQNITEIISIKGRIYDLQMIILDPDPGEIEGVLSPGSW